MWILLVLLVIILIIAASSIKIVKQSEVYIIERLGKFYKVADAGLTIIIPFFDHVRSVVSLKQQTMDVPPQGVITKDNVTITIDTVVFYQITDPAKAVYEIQSLKKGIEYLAITTIRDIIGKMDLDETFSSRDGINNKLRVVLDEATDRWGCKIDRVEIKDITPPADIRDAMEKEMNAERNKRAMILESEAQRQSAITIAEGKKQAAILEAEADKEAKIRRADGEAQAIKAVAEAKAKEIKMVYEAMKNAAPDDKLVQLKNKLIRELQRRVKDEAKKDWVAKELDSLDLQQLHNLYGKKTIDDFKDEDEQYAYLSRRLAKRRLRVIADAIYNNYFLDFYNQYNKFLHQVEVPKTISQREWATMILAFQDEIEYHRLELMHAAPLMYLRDLISGTGQNRSFQYVFIDEMQDYSTAMLIYLKHAFPQAKFTVLGDSEQALFKPLQLPEELLNKLSGVLKAKRPNLIALRRSYRSTTEITNFAKALLPDGDKIISFTRHGKKPRLLVRYSDKESQQSLLDETLKLADEHETVAILTKNQEQAAAIYQLLHRQKVENIHLLDKDASELPKGILILPIYLAKGLEFDAVLAADVSAKNLANTDEVGMIYTMASRAMHELVLLSNGSVSDAINEKAGRLLTIEYQLPNKN